MSRAGVAEGTISGEHLREAERGFVAMLRAKGFPAPWIEANVFDLLAQAASEYARWLTEHDPEPNPVGWLIVCAYRRAVNLLDSQRRRPETTSLEVIYGVADEDAATPEQQALENDSQRRLREALGMLPRQDRRLLAMVYFEGRSVREAGRRMGWRKSAADRHHRAALDRLREIVGSERSLLSPAAIGLAAWVSLIGERSRGVSGARDAVAAHLEGAMGALAEGGRRLGELARRLLPFAEAGGVAGSGGAGRVAGACGAGIAAAVCGLLVAGVAPTLPGHTGSSPPHRPDRPKPAAAVRSTPEPEATAPSEPGTAVADGRHRTARHRHRMTRRRIAAHRAHRRPAPVDSRPVERTVSGPSPTAVTEDFGIEAEERAPAETPTTAPSGPAASSPKKAPAAPSATGAQVEEEFGL